MDSNSIEHQSCPLCKSKLIGTSNCLTRNLNANYVCENRQEDEEDGDELNNFVADAPSSEGDGVENAK